MRDRELFAREMDVLGGGGDSELPSVQHEIPEVVKQGASHYLTLEPEKYRDKIPGREPDAKYAPIKQVGIFVPPAARTAAEVDVLVFLHGHVTECGVTERSFTAEGIRALWNSKHFSCLRQAIVDSGKPIMLVVPKMDPWVGKNKGSAGYLNFDREMVSFAMVRAAFREMVALGELDKNAELRSPNFAAFGAGGEPLQQIVMNAGVSFPSTCIGFETLSFGHQVWKTWSQCQGTILYHYRRKGWNEKFMSTWFKRGIVDKTVDAKTRCELFCKLWPEAISHIKTAPGSGTPTRELEVPKPSNGSSNAGGAGTTAFVTKTWTLQDTPTKLVSTGNRKAWHAAKAAHPAWTPAQLPAFVQIQQAPAVFLKTIIRRAGALARAAGKTAEAAVLDPDTWFRQFTRIPFLGRELNKNEYIHVEFAKKLQQVENSLVQQLGGTAQTAGDTLLFNSQETHPASRPQSSTAAYSFHMFGLAIDVNYLGNPFVDNDDIGVLNGVLKRASELLRADTLRYTRASGPAYYDVVERLDQLLEQYFALLDDAPGLQTKIAAATRGEWRGVTAAKARRRIQADVDNLSVALVRRRHKRTGADLRPYFKTHAILNFDKRLVVAMDNASVDWGARYGDMMHFDMRTAGVGAYILRAIGEHKAKAERQMNAKLAAQEHGYHTFVD